MPLALATDLKLELLTAAEAALRLVDETLSACQRFLDRYRVRRMPAQVTVYE
jgi:hypothetical protein